MVNEILFFLHALIVVGFVMGALRLGQTGLTALIVLQSVLANLFVLKQMELFGFSVTCSDVFAIGGLLCLNLLQEYYGKEGAQKAVRISFLSLVFFALMSQIHLLYIPLAADTTQGAFTTLFAPAPRIVFASIGVYFLVQKIDVAWFGFLQRTFPGKPFLFRLLFSLLPMQLLDTVLFSFLGLFGLVSSLFDIIVLSFAVKCLILFCTTPLIAFSKRFVKRDLSV